MNRDPQILIVDDDEAPREMLTDFCESLGFKGLPFTDVDEAKAYLRDDRDIDLIILDVFIKGRNSLYFADDLKNTKYADIPIIIISGATSSEYIQEALSKGVYDFVAKPFTLQQIRERMENALKFCLSRKQDKSYFSQVENLLRERTDMLEKLAIQSVKALANAIEARDPYTRGHSERVATLAVKIAAELGYEEEALTKLNLAGLLHDVGKVGIPDLILLKPGRLSEFEYTIMMNHPGMSALIVSEIMPLQSILPWIKHHHEYFNGTGYPDKLKGDEIPQEAQIIAIADNYDALTSIRPYRTKMGKQDVLEYIDYEFTRKFNPALRDVALRVLREAEATAESRNTISPFIEQFKDSMIYIDYLTGLYWYPYLKGCLDERIAVRMPFHLLYIDIDGISVINKQFGRIKGDEVIVRTANVLAEEFVSPDVVVRVGGDDFMAYCPEGAARLMEKIDVVRRKLATQGIQVSEKLLTFPEDGSDFEELFSKVQ